MALGTLVIGSVIVLMVHPDAISRIRSVHLSGREIVEVLAYPTAGLAMIWAGRKLRYLAYPKADPRSVASAEYVVYASGAPSWADGLAAIFVTLGSLSLIYLTAGYNPPALIPRVFVAFGLMWLAPRVWVGVTNEASRDLRWKLRRFYPDVPLIWDTGPCLCVGGQEIPWTSISMIDSRKAGFWQYVRVRSQNPWVLVEVDVALALQSLDAIETELSERWLKKAGGSQRSLKLAPKDEPREEAKAA